MVKRLYVLTPSAFTVVLIGNPLGLDEDLRLIVTTNKLKPIYFYLCQYTVVSCRKVLVGLRHPATIGISETSHLKFCSLVENA